jgi:hypothetical protein
MNKNFRKRRNTLEKQARSKMKAAKKQIALPGLQSTRKQHFVFSPTSKSQSNRKATATPS